MIVEGNDAKNLISHCAIDFGEPQHQRALGKSQSKVKVRCIILLRTILSKNKVLG